MASEPAVRDEAGRELVDALSKAHTKAVEDGDPYAVVLPTLDLTIHLDAQATALAEREREVDLLREAITRPRSVLESFRNAPDEFFEKDRAIIAEVVRNEAAIALDEMDAALSPSPNTETEDHG